MCNLRHTDVFIEASLRFQHKLLLFWCLWISPVPANSNEYMYGHRYWLWFHINGHWGKYPGFILLNDEKTERLIIGSKYRQIPQSPYLHVGSSIITPAPYVKKLGVTMDSKFTMELCFKTWWGQLSLRYVQFHITECCDTLLCQDTDSHLHYF